MTLASRASDLAVALPHALFRGPAQGFAFAAGVDWSRSHRAEQLPAPAAAQILWQQQAPGGVSCNLLVDAEGRVFVAGMGRVSQFASDGMRQFSHRTGLQDAVAAALLADGARVILTREGTLRSWSALGRPGFDVHLDAPAPRPHASLLPLPDGGLLVGAGAWMFNLDVSGSIRSHIKLTHDIDQTLIANDRALVIDVRGDVLEWDGQSAPHHRGSFGGRVTQVAARDQLTLIGLLSDQALVELSWMTGIRRELNRFERPRLLPVMAIPSAGLIAVMNTDGAAYIQGRDKLVAQVASARGVADPITGAHLLASPSGTLAWLAANAPLRLQLAGENDQELSEVRCAQPASIVPGRAMSIIVACRPGQLWQIGSAAHGRDASFVPVRAAP